MGFAAHPTTERCRHHCNIASGGLVVAALLGFLGCGQGEMPPGLSEPTPGAAVDVRGENKGSQATVEGSSAAWTGTPVGHDQI